MKRPNPRRVLLVTSNYPRWEGDATTPFVLNLAVDLEATGWEVDVLAPHAPKAARRESLSGVEVRRFRYLLPESQQTVCYEGGALINLRQTKSNWLKLPFLVVAEFLVTLLALARGRYHAINAHWILPQGFVAGLAGILTRTPVVVTVHGGDVFDLGGGFLTRLKAWSLRRAAIATANSTATRAATEDLAPDADVRTIPMGVNVSGLPDDIETSKLRAQYRFGTGPLLLFVGRLVWEKGVDDLLHAVAQLRTDMPDARLVVVGTGQDRPVFEALSTSLGLEDRVTFTGWVDPSSVPAYMTAADILIGPSKQSETGWREGLGLVFLEAMAVGTPVIATRSGGIPDIVMPGQTGLLVSENAPDEIADAIRRLGADPGLTERIVARGRDLVNETYSREASAAAFAAVFDEVAKA